MSVQAASLRTTTQPVAPGPVAEHVSVLHVALSLHSEFVTVSEQPVDALHSGTVHDLPSSSHIEFIV